MKINKTFLNQTKEKDFEIIKEKGEHYKDKTFCFEVKDIKNNCILSSDYDKNFKLLETLKFYNYINYWRKNDYSYPKFGIKKEDFDPKITFKYVIDYNSNQTEDKYKIDENTWINTWEKKLKALVFRGLRKTIFQQIGIPKIKEYLRGKNEELLEEFDEVVEVLSLSECRRNNLKYKFKDHNNNKWIEKNFSDLKIFKNKIDCTNIAQGYLGTCYFLEALSTLSNRGQLLYQLFPVENIKDDGLYEICLYHEEEWYKILLDDYLVFYKRENKDEPLKFLFTQPAKECLYSCLLEKAFAKLNGSYSDINEGHEIQAFTALTGFDSLVFSHYRINKELINQMKIFLKKDFLLSGASGDYDSEGKIINGHAYSIINSENDYFVVRNPWSKLKDKDIKMQKKCDHMKKLKFDLKEDGLFKIRENDLKQFFNIRITSCMCLFGQRVYKIKLENLGNIQKDKKLYFSFKTSGETNIVINLQNKLSTDEEKILKPMDSYKAKLEYISDNNNEIKEKNLITFNNLKKKLLETNPKFNDFNFENEKIKGKCLGIISFEFLESFKNQVLTIIIDKNIDINIIGYLDKKPDITNNDTFSKSSNEIEYTNYFYGEKSDEIRKKYKNVYKLMKYLNCEIPDDYQGVYVETIFDDGYEEANFTDKNNKNLKRCFTFDKRLKKFIYKFTEENGKVTEKQFTYEQINDIKIHDIHESDIEPNISFEKPETDRKLFNKTIYNKLEEDIYKANLLKIEQDYSCFCGSSINYSLKCNENELKMCLKGSLINFVQENFFCCRENEIMEVKIKLKDILYDYAIIKNIKNCSICKTSINMNVFLEKEKDDKRFEIRKLIKSSDNNLMEIYDCGTLLFKIFLGGNDSDNLYEIGDLNNEIIGNIKMINEIDNRKKISYEIKFEEHNKIDYKLKIMIIFAGILIQN